MNLNLTSEQYARARVFNSPLRLVYLQNQNLKLKKEESKLMPGLNSHAYKNIQTVVGQLMLMTLSDNEGLSLSQVAEVIKIEAGNFQAGGLEFIHNVIAANEQEQTEEEEAEEELEKEEYIRKKLDDWEDRKEEVELGKQTCR